mgnify:CR=1 FL=1
MEDVHFRDKIFHFDHERIPERVVHARGMGGVHAGMAVFQGQAGCGRDAQLARCCPNAQLARCCPNDQLARCCTNAQLGREHPGGTFTPSGGTFTARVHDCVR